MIAHSNHLKALTDLLAQVLYTPGSKPFDERIIVVPDSKMKGAIFEALTQNTKGSIAAGLTVMNLAGAIEAISNDAPPTLLELSFFLEMRLHAYQNHPDFSAISAYLEVATRIGPLSETLSRIFWDYSLFGGKALKSWSEKPGWQQLLWTEVNANWTLPHDLKFRVKKNLFLFGFAYLPPLYLHLFSEAEAKMFFFSPCSAFFADYATEREKVHLERVEGFKETLEGQHKLLANLGKLGKSMQETLVDLGGAVFEPFILNEKETLLAAFQNDLVNGETVSQPAFDQSIQCFSAPSRLREVEVLKEKLLPLLSGEHPVKPTEILIVAPDISEYSAALKNVFESQEYSIPLAIEGLPEATVNRDGQRLQALFELVQERFAPGPLFQFLEGMPDLPQEELYLMKQFESEANVRWGLNRAQREAFTGSKESEGTWETNLLRLARGMAFLDAPQVVGQVQWEALNRLYSLLEMMSRDLKPFWDGEKRSVDVWARFFLSIIEKYINPVFGLSGELKQLAFGFTDETPIPFESARRMVDLLLKKPTGAYQTHLQQAITCSSIKEGVFWPHKVVALLGFEEGSFPKSEQATALFDPTLENGARPKKNDRDRYLFLQLLLSASEKLFLSGSLENEGLSHLMRKLLLFIEETYQLTLEVEHHPLLPFDRAYFTQNSLLTNYSQRQFQAATTLALNKKSSPLVPSFYKKLSLPTTELQDTTVQQLEKFARNPLKFYLQERLQFYPQPLNEDLDRGEFTLSFLKRYHMVRLSLTTNVDEVIAVSRARGLFPAGNLGALAEDHLRREVEQREEQLEKLGIEKESLFEVLLHPFYRQWTELGPSLFGAPPIQLQNGSQITGTLGPLCSRGLLHFGADGFEGWARCWPSFLILGHLPQLPQKLLSLKKSSEMRCSLDDPEKALLKYLHYFEMGKEMPSPVMPEWLKLFLEKDVASLTKQLQQFEVTVAGNFVDPSWQWLLRRDRCPKPPVLIANWADQVEQTFGGYFDL